jgi:16S rRNA processing protein RimM
LSKAPPVQAHLVSLGKVTGAHGLQGAIKVRATAETATTDPEVITALGEVVVGGRSYGVLGAERFKNQVLLRLEGIRDRGQAQELVGLEVQGDRRRFPALPPGEYFWFQLLGLPVLNAGDGVLLGYLEEVIPTPAHDVYVVRLGEREVLLPAVVEVVVEINLQEGYVKVSPPAGLLEIYAD